MEKNFRFVLVNVDCLTGMYTLIFVHIHVYNMYFIHNSYIQSAIRQRIQEVKCEGAPKQTLDLKILTRRDPPPPPPTPGFEFPRSATDMDTESDKLSSG